MRRLRILLGLCFVGVALGFSQQANAQALVTFDYDDLMGDFNATSLLFTATDNADSFGNATRIVSPGGDAIFEGLSGSNGFLGMAAFDLAMTISNLTTTSADASGTIMLTDVQGDSFSGNLQGTWTKNILGSGSFSGVLSNVIPSNPSADGSFDGSSGPGLSMTFLDSPPFSGAVFVLDLEAGNWFTDGAGASQGFSTALTRTQGVIVPEPATLAFLALGGLIAGCRYRRRH